MPMLTNQTVAENNDRTYHVHVPDNPTQATVPAIVVFHGGGQDAATIARRWGLQPGNPVPANVADYLLVFPEGDSRLAGEWVALQEVRQCLSDVRPGVRRPAAAGDHHHAVRHGSASVPDVSADPALVYARRILQRCRAWSGN